MLHLAKNFVRHIFISSSRAEFSPVHTLPPLHGVRVIELSGIAPGPFCGLILADFGASVTRIVKPNEDSLIEDRLTRGKKSNPVDLKTQEGIHKILNLCEDSDVLIDPYRPGVLEKLGLDPRKLLQRNSRLIVSRITGYGQTGELANNAGHDINYVALSGLLSMVSRGSQRPTPPANLLADFCGGSLLAAFGIMLALFERERSGRGQIIDVSMTEGLAYLGSFINLTQDKHSFWDRDHGIFSGNSPIYRTYKTADGKFIAVGALERKFQAILFQKLNLSVEARDLQERPDYIGDLMEKIFERKTRGEWVEIFKDCDACVTPVLELDEVGDYEHHRSRENFECNWQNQWVPLPAPRLSRTPANEPASTVP